MEYEFILETIHRTCMACPSQWAGETDDGREVYIRYRYGTLEIWVADSSDSEESIFNAGKMVFYETIGGPFEGTLTYEEMVTAVDNQQPSLCKWPASKPKDEPSRERLHEILSNTLKMVEELHAANKLQIVSDEELRKLESDPDSDLLFVTDDKQILEEKRMKGKSASKVEEFIKDLKNE